MITPAPQPLTFQDHSVRHVFIDGDPWFMAKDICGILYDRFDPQKGVTEYIKNLREDEKWTLTHRDVPGNFLGSKCYSSAFVTESGMYKIALRAQSSKRPNVAAFQDWVTREVLPSIHKTGSFHVANTLTA